MDREVHQKPSIAISSCILGNRVRYDAAIVNFDDICEHLQQHVELVAVCPEVEIGLSVPRPAVQLTGEPGQPRMTGRDNPNLDITETMISYCKQKTLQLKPICGYVFKSRSPSCGLNNVPIFHLQSITSHAGRGLFASAICQAYPGLPMIEETDLNTAQQRQRFIEQVLNYYKNPLDA